MSNNVGDRIKILRNQLELTQQEFADRLGVKRGTIANYELGRNEPIDAVVTLICHEFNVDRVWLETGEGEPFREVSRDEYIAEALSRAITGNDTARDRLIRAFCMLPDDMFDEAERILDEVISNLQKEKE